MSSTEALQRLREERNIWLATVRADGRPHLAPVWFAHVDDRIWIGTGTGSVRVRNLRANPAASFSLEGGNAPVVGEGRAVIHERDRPADVAAAFAAKYDWDITQPVDEDIGVVVLLEVVIERWLHGLDLPTSDP